MYLLYSLSVMKRMFCLNLSSLYGEVLSGLRAQGGISGWELVFVDDCSTDQSVSILEKLDRDYKDTKIITMSRTFGVSECVMAGLAHTKGEAVIYMDCDLQDPPALIPQMIAAWREGENVGCGPYTA